MPIRDMSKEVYLSSNDERTFDEDSNYSLYPSYEANFNIQTFATKLGDLKRPFSLPYKSIRNSVNFTFLSYKNSRWRNRGTGRGRILNRPNSGLL